MILRLLRPACSKGPASTLKARVCPARNPSQLTGTGSCGALVASRITLLIEIDPADALLRSANGTLRHSPSRAVSTAPFSSDSRTSMQAGQWPSGVTRPPQPGVAHRNRGCAHSGQKTAESSCAAAALQQSR